MNKYLAKITDEGGNTRYISYNNGQLFMNTPDTIDFEAFGPEFASEQVACEYIHASYGNNWQLTWEEN